MNTRSQRKNAGFTLIELMITVAVVAILASIAYPSYQESVAKGKRAQAKTVLASAQQWLERHYSENYRYDQTLAGTNIDNTAGGIFNSQFGVAPLAGEGNAAYNITLTTENAGRNYTLTAARISPGSMASDRCGDFVVTSTGRKSVVNHTGFGTGAVGNLAAAQKCWN
ncbi:type IV pilin protein [Variovorax sp. J22R133]|uniref:type IV pilin protein n=1 Tax=Variovorax brevis TaxID=3053503 RepID=UPI002575424A|nr:type IV pilin protein [Variovorax sp. J22R133]MDM0115282.1 type IV pilin protein [Variovorax sp. J22R133]